MFERRGDSDGDPQGFVSAKTGGQDNPAGGDLGNWFLRQPQGIGPLPGPFVVDYDTTEIINELSGEIWDIDAVAAGNERWRVEVLDRLGNVVDFQDSPLGISQSDPDSLDSLPWRFEFRDLTAKSTTVDKVRLRFTGSKTNDVGLAFNNFSAFQVVPEPSGVVLCGLGLAGLLAVGARGKAREDARA